jgi:hypothetical protein
LFVVEDVMNAFFAGGQLALNDVIGTHASASAVRTDVPAGDHSV